MLSSTMKHYGGKCVLSHFATNFLFLSWHVNLCIKMLFSYLSILIRFPFITQITLHPFVQIIVVSGWIYLSQWRIWLFYSSMTVLSFIACNSSNVQSGSCWGSSRVHDCRNRSLARVVAFRVCLIVTSINFSARLWI